MQRLEVSGAVRHIDIRMSLGGKGLSNVVCLVVDFFKFMKQN
jgi:hypothetical protein